MLQYNPQVILAADLQEFLRRENTCSAAADHGCRSSALAAASFHFGMLAAYCFQKFKMSQSEERSSIAAT